MRASRKNEMETHIEKTLPRILTKHFKKTRSGLNNLMDRIAALFRMINDTEEKDEEFIQDAYTYRSFYYKSIYRIK
jgi:phage-related protein